jgi:hypothetical protein
MAWSEPSEPVPAAVKAVELDDIAALHRKITTARQVVGDAKAHLTDAQTTLRTAESAHYRAENDVEFLCDEMKKLLARYSAEHLGE